jgi:hypothetical protein
MLNVALSGQQIRSRQVFSGTANAFDAFGDGDLLAVLITMVVVKWGAMAWYYVTD